MAKDWIEEEGDAGVGQGVGPFDNLPEWQIVPDGVETADKGLSAPINAKENGGRSETGQFLPGHSIKSPGRPKKADELAILNAIRGSFPPEKVKAYLTTAMRLAEEQNSARGMLAVLEFAASYTLGKPVQRIEMADGGLADMAIELGIDITEE